MINIVEICRLKYPGEIEAGNITFRQPDKEIVIGTWNVSGIDRPSENDLLSESSLYESTYKLNAFQLLGQTIVADKVQAVAQEKQYDNDASCASYALSTNPQWKAEAMAFIEWRDAVYTYALEIFDLIAQGKDAPTEQDFIAKIPSINWPA